MNTVSLSDAKRDFSNGVLRGFEIVRAPMEKGYQIVIRTKEGNSWTLAKARSTEPRFFKTLDAAASTVLEIGFAFESLAGN